MELVAEKLTIKMTRTEFQIIRNFLDIMEKDIFCDWEWKDLIEDFPLSIPNNCSLKRDFYNILVVED